MEQFQCRGSLIKLISVFTVQTDYKQICGCPQPLCCATAVALVAGRICAGPESTNVTPPAHVFVVTRRAGTHGSNLRRRSPPKSRSAHNEPRALTHPKCSLAWQSHDLLPSAGACLGLVILFLRLSSVPRCLPKLVTQQPVLTRRCSVLGHVLTLAATSACVLRPYCTPASGLHPGAHGNQCSKR